MDEFAIMYWPSSRWALVFYENDDWHALLSYTREEYVTRVDRRLPPSQWGLPWIRKSNYCVLSWLCCAECNECSFNDYLCSKCRAT